MQAEKGAKLLADDILKDAKDRAAEAVREAKRQAASIVEAARVSAKEEEKRKLTEARTRGQRVYEILAQAKMKAKKDILLKKEALINEIFKEAEERLRDHVVSKGYREDLIRIAVGACRKLVSKDVMIRANQRDLKMLESSRELIESELSSNRETVRISLGKPIQTIGGVRVGTLDGKVEIDETLEGIMQRQFDILRVKVAKFLFEGS